MERAPAGMEALRHGSADRLRRGADLTPGDWGPQTRGSRYVLGTAELILPAAAPQGGSGPSTAPSTYPSLTQVRIVSAVGIFATGSPSTPDAKRPRRGTEPLGWGRTRAESRPPAGVPRGSACPGPRSRRVRPAGATRGRCGWPGRRRWPGREPGLPAIGGGGEGLFLGGLSPRAP